MGGIRELKFKLAVLSSIACSVMAVILLGAGMRVTGASASTAQATCGPFQFRDAGPGEDPAYTGPTFQMSQNYPTRLPIHQAKPWEKFDFRTEPEQYLRSVLKYVLAGNTTVEFQGHLNRLRRWYHAPWLTRGSFSSREYVRGLTRERNSAPGELHPQQTQRVTNYAVSMYNRLGGYTIGQVWCDPANPNAAAALFPNGTVAFKLLFTTADETQVPYLDGTLEWQAFVRLNNASPRQVQMVRLLQVDVAVRDQRADDTTGWVFGTFVYDGAQAGNTVWDRLVPIGLMWGNDSTLTTADFLAGQRPVESIILNDTIGGFPLKLGWNRRLNGPVDNPQSSCLSCHSTAQDPLVRDFAPNANASDDERTRFFQNILAPASFELDGASLDYSLQLAQGIEKCRQAGICPTPALTPP